MYGDSETAANSKRTFINGEIKASALEFNNTNVLYFKS